MAVARAFEVEHLGETIVLHLRRSVEEIQFDHPPPDAVQLLDQLRRPEIKNLVIDCHEIDFLRSTALGFFVTLSKVVKDKGQMVLCNVSPKALEILRMTKLDQIWKICASRASALKEIEG